MLTHFRIFFCRTEKELCGYYLIAIGNYQALFGKSMRVICQQIVTSSRPKLLKLKFPGNTDKRLERPNRIILSN